MSDFVIPNLQIEKVIQGINKGIRLDGRKLSEYRDIDIKVGISENAEGSVAVKVGKTEVLCGVKMDVVEPYPDSADEGTLSVSAELHPMSSKDFDMGKPGINAIELARVVDRGIRESGFIDFKKLCIKEGEKVWQVFLDIVTLNDDGNLLDVAGLAALIALSHAKMPVYNEKEDKIEHELTDKPVPLDKDAISFNMTFYKLGNEIIIDPTKEEEEIANFRLSAAIADNNGEARITAMQKGKEGVISPADMEKILNLIEDKFKEMYPKFKKLVWDKKK